MAFLQEPHESPEAPSRLRYADHLHLDLFLFMRQFSDVLFSNGRSRSAISHSPARYACIARDRSDNGR